MVGHVRDSVVAGLDSSTTSIIDAKGLTLIPGLVEGHAHLSFHGT